MIAKATDGSVLPASETSSADRPEYNPGRVEEAILKHLVSEYGACKGVSSEYREQCAVIRAMQLGSYRNNPYDPSPFSQVYIPFVAQKIELKADLNIQRLIPDQDRLDFFELQMSDPLGEKVAAELQQTAGIPPEEAPRFANRMMTLALRDLLYHSNFVAALRDCLVNTPAIGYSLMVPEICTTKTLVPAEDVFGDDPDALVLDPETGAMKYRHPAIIEMDDPETGGKVQMVSTVDFAGLRFNVLDQANIMVPNAECDEGISALPFFYFYQVQSFRSIRSKRMIRSGGQRLNGMYLNTECIRPLDESPLPSSHESFDGPDEYSDSQAWYPGDRSRPANGAGQIETPMRVGKFNFEAIPEFQEAPPTGEEMKAFRRKFGIKAEDFVEEKVWVIEWTATGAARVLLRFEAWPLPTIGNTQSVAIEMRNYHHRGRTFGVGVYQRGGMDLEILANKCFQDRARIISRQANPPMWVQMGLVDKSQRQLIGDQLTFQEGEIIRLSREAQKGAPFGEIMSSPQSAESAREGLEDCLRQIETVVGINEAVIYGGSSSTSATATLTQRSYTEQLLIAQTRPVEQMLREWLTQALALLTYVVQKGGAYRFSVPESSLEAFGEMFKGNPSMEFTITPDLIARGWSIKILTAGAMGDREGTLNRLERLNQIYMANAPFLQQQGALPNFRELISLYVDALGFSRNIMLSTPQESPQLDAMLGQMAGNMAAGAGDGQSDGGAGVPRPDYARQAAELSAPGEATPGMGATPQRMAGIQGALGT